MSEVNECPMAGNVMSEVNKCPVAGNPFDIILQSALEYLRGTLIDIDVRHP